MGEFASKGLAGSALGIGIGGLALSALNGGGCGNGGVLGNLFGGNGHCEPMESKESAMLRQQVATLTSEKYADGIGLQAYKEAVALSNTNDDKLRSVQDALTTAVIALDKQAAVNQANINCLVGKVDLNTANIRMLQDEACDSKTREAVLNSSIKAVASDATAAIALEAERRACGDKALRCFVEATYVPGSLVMPITSICPEPEVAR